MSEQKIYGLWDEQEGQHPSKFYLDKKSAEVGLIENYSEEWIYANRAKIVELKVISYFHKG